MKNRKFDWKIVIRIAAGMLFAACLLLIVRFVVNWHYTRMYRWGDYRLTEENLLVYTKGPEEYIPYYNLGCGHYESGEFKKAREAFEQALAF